MRILIIGAGKVGSRIAKELSVEKHEITVIDKEVEPLMELSDKADVLTMVGNGVDPTALDKAGAKTADFVMAVTRNDDVNIICCLIAKNLGAKRTVARVRDPIYASQFEFLNKNLGITLTINPEKETAESIARFLRYPGAEQVEIINGRTEIVGIRIEIGSVLADKELAVLSQEFKLKVLACAIDRGGDIIIPHGNTKVEIGDIVYFTGARVSLYALMSRLGFNNHISNVMILGGDKIAHYLGKSLLENGFHVKIVDSDRERCEELADALPRANVIHGDATNRQLLTEEGIDRVDAVITLTGNDETNAILSLFAKAHGADMVITKLSEGIVSEFVDTLNVGIVVSPCDVIAEELIKITRATYSGNAGSSIESLYKIVNDKVEAVTFLVGDDCGFTNKMLKELKLRQGIIVAGIVRGDEYIIPDGSSVINKEDEVLIISTKYKIKRISDILA